MWMWIRNLLLAGVVVLLAIPVWCEYYQYTDKNGALRFTDDLAAVPQDQRPDVKTYESVKSRPVQAATGTRVEEKGTVFLSPAKNATPSLTGTWKEKISRQADELDLMQAELNQTFVALRNERNALEAKAPAAGVPLEVSNAYQKQVDTLNANIERYEKQHAEYKEKVKAFNAQHRK